MSDGQENKTEERRPLTPEERERMKRELKAQLRAYVDELKAQMLGAKDEGERPGLDEAMKKAEEELERKARAARAMGDPMVEEAARMQARARAQARPAPPRHDGVIPKITNWRPAEEDDAVTTKAEKTAPAANTEEAAREAKEKDVIDVSAPPQAEIATSGAGEAEKAAEETGAAEKRPEEERHLVPDEEAAKSALPREELERLTRDIIAALKTVYDPEIPVDIYELGLVYRIDIADDRTVTIDMTLTAPGCPVAGEMPAWVQKAVSEVEGVKQVKVNLVFDPPWDMSRMSDEARLALNMF